MLVAAGEAAVGLVLLAHPPVVVRLLFGAEAGSVAASAKRWRMELMVEVWVDMIVARLMMSGQRPCVT